MSAAQRQGRSRFWLWLRLAPGVVLFVGGLAVAALAGTTALLAALVVAGGAWALGLCRARPARQGLGNRLDNRLGNVPDIDDQLIHSQKMAVLGELSSGIAHEINTPLGIIGQESELLGMLADRYEKKGFEDIDELRERLEQIAIQVERCGDITHQLLTFARKNEAVLQETDVAQVAEDMIRLVEREARHQHVVIKREYGEEQVRVLTDPALLRQVVLNLLQNAVQAVGQVQARNRDRTLGEEGVVTVSTRAADGRVELHVADTGCGIAPENLQRVFDPFFTTKPPGKGTGLGLSICMKIAHRLGGHIRVRSELGVGTEFTVQLPIST